MPISDWSSDVCSSGLQDVGHGAGPISPPGGGSSGRVHTSSSPYPPCHPDKRAPSHITQIVIPAKRSEEHTSELQSLMRISYAVFCLKKKKSIIVNLPQ